MLKWFVKRQIAAFGARYDYAVDYLHEVADIDLGAAIAFSRLSGISDYRKGIPAEPYFAAKLRTILLDDCGPCTQLAVNMATEAGVAGDVLAAVVAGDVDALPAETALTVRFAEAVLAHAPEADSLRAQIVARWGERALLSLAFTISSARVYPALKYALGHGHACQRVQVDGRAVAPGATLTAAAGA